MGLPLGSAKTLDSICADLECQLSNIKRVVRENNLPTKLSGALRSLKLSRDIVVSKADMGDAIVIMDKEHYTQLTWDHLSNGGTYCPLSTDPTPEIVKRFNAYLDTCLEDKVIDPGIYDRLKLPSNTCPQSMYFLPKVHKHPTKV